MFLLKDLFFRSAQLYNPLLQFIYQTKLLLFITVEIFFHQIHYRGHKIFGFQQ